MLISKEFKFEAAHILPRHPGKCSREHGHSWRVVVEVGGPINPATCFVMDYADLKKVVQPIIDRFDHQHLNAFVKYPSSENLAIHIAHLLRPYLSDDSQGEPPAYYVVKVSETQSTWSIWDSRVQYCRDIFDKDSLDTRMGAMDAEWRSPNPGRVDDVPKEISELETIAPVLFQQWLDVNASIQQLKLYRDSLTPVDLKKEIESGVKDS